MKKRVKADGGGCVVAVGDGGRWGGADGSGG